MRVARQHDEVRRLGVADAAQDLGPLRRVAVPLVEVEELPRLCIEEILAEHHLVRPDLPGRRRAHHLVDEPGLLRRPEHGARRVGPLGAAGGLVALVLDVAAGRPVAIQPLVGHHQLHELAEAEVAIDLDRALPAARRIELHVGEPVLAPRLVRRLAQRWLRRRRGQRRRVGVLVVVLVAVVVELVVVPEQDHRELLVHRLDVEVGAIRLILVAIIVEPLRILRAGRVGRQHPHRTAARDRRVAAAGAVVAILVDVVAKMHDDVDLLVLGEQPIRRVVAVAVILADDVADAELRQMLVRPRHRLETSGPARHPGMDEAVVVDGERLERAVRHRQLHCIVMRREDRRRPLQHQALGRKIRLGRDLPGDHRARLGADGGWRHPRPQDDTVRVGIARGDALRVSRRLVGRRRGRVDDEQLGRPGQARERGVNDERHRVRVGLRRRLAQHAGDRPAYRATRQGLDKSAPLHDSALPLLCGGAYGSMAKMGVMF